MPSVSSEIIAEITAHMGKFGGDFSAWCVGTARDWHSPVLEAHEREDKDDDFICREAYTPASARSVRLHFAGGAYIAHYAMCAKTLKFSGSKIAFGTLV